MRWDLSFKTPIAAEGRELATLRDAAEYIVERLPWPSPDRDGAIEDLMTAAATGDASDVEAARVQTARMLNARYLIPAERPKAVPQRWGRQRRARA